MVQSSNFRVRPITTERSGARMNRVSSFAVGVAVGIAGLYIMMHFTLVRAGDGFHLVPKIAAKVDMPYTDIRKFTLGN